MNEPHTADLPVKSLSRSLTRRVLVLSLIGMLGVGCTIVLGLLLTLNQVQARMDRINVEAISLFDRFFLDIQSDLQATSDGLAAWGNKNYALLALQKRNNSFLDVLYISPDGVILAQRNAMGRPKQKTIEQQAWLESLPAFGEVVIGPLHFEGKTPYVDMATTATDDIGLPAGLLLVRVDLTELWNTTLDVKVGNTGYAYIADNTGQLVAYRNWRLLETGSTLGKLVGRSPQTIAASRLSFYTGLNGEPVLASAQLLKTVSWFAVVEQPASEALAPLVIPVLVLLIILVIACLLLYNTIRFTRFRVVSPLLALRDAVMQMADGQLEQSVEIQRNDELGQLGHSFNRMAGQLQQVFADLESRIGALQQSQRALHESQERYRTLFETANDAIFVMDWDVFFECNLKTVELFGCGEKSEIIGRTPVDFSPAQQPDGRASSAKAEGYIRAALDGTPQFFYWQHRTKDQTLMDTEVSLNSLKFKGKTYLQAIVRDISERKRADEALQQQSRLQELLMNISATYINQPLEAVEPAIHASLGELAEFVGADRSYIYDYDFHNQTCRATHEWCSEGVEPQIAQYPSVALASIPDWDVEAHRRGEAIWLPDMLSLSPGTLRDKNEPVGTKSMFAVPLMSSGECLGFVGFDWIRQHHAYSGIEQRLLTVFALMLVNIRRRKQGEETLRKSEEKYRAIFENAFEGIYQTTPQGSFISVNPALVKMFGFASAQDMISSATDIGQQLYVYPEERQKLMELGYQNGKVENYETEMRRKDGQTIWVSINILVVRDAGGAVLYLEGTLLDITQRRQMEQDLIERSNELGEMVAQLEEENTERKRAEETARESENRFRTLAEATFEGIVISENGRIIDANQQLAQMFGYSLPEVIGMPLSSFVIPELKDLLDDIQAKGEERIGEYRALRKDGSEFIIETHGRMFEMDQRWMRITSVRDITERKRAEEALRRDAERSKALARISARINASLGLQEVLDAVCEEIAHIMEAPVTMIWLVDDELKYFYVQAAFGVPPEIYEQVKPVPNRIHPLWQKKLENIYYMGNVQEIEDNNNGSLIQKLGLHATIHCQCYNEGRFIGMLSVLRHELGWNYSDADLTLLNTLSNQIAIAIHHAQLYEQVKNGRQRLQVMSEKLVDIQEAERRHLAIELHDEIGQALTHIKMSLDRYDPDNPEQKHLESAREMILDLMKQVRSLSLELRPTILDDLGLLPAVLWHIERYTALSGIQVDLKPSGVDRRFRTQVESTAYRILQESLTNIARHARATRVTVSLWADEERLGLQVEDNGAGFDPAAALQKMTGGLSGMQERAAICGGQLLIDSTPGQGTYISLELPLQGDYLERRTR